MSLADLIFSPGAALACLFGLAWLGIRSERPKKFQTRKESK